MGTYRVREIRIALGDGETEKLSRLREYELEANDAAAAIEGVRHFLEVEILSLTAPQKIDFDALVILDQKGREIARFKVSDIWRRQADAVETGKTYQHWVQEEERPAANSRKGSTASGAFFGG